MLLSSVRSRSGLNLNVCSIQRFGSGLINNTWKIINGKKTAILQPGVNAVVTLPNNNVENIRLISDYFQQNYPEYLFNSLVQYSDRKDLLLNKKELGKLFSGVQNPHTVNTVQTPEEAYEAAKQFGRFTKLLAAFDTNKLKITIPDFHNLSLCYYQFQKALKEGNKERIRKSAFSIGLLQEQVNIVTEYNAIKENADFRVRVTLHDTRISNILFDENNRSLGVLALDSVMPGYFISDVGEMIRTCLSPVGEDKKDFSKIEVREEYFMATVKGYLHEMNDELTSTEKNYFVYAGKFIIYMQALRFLTDYLNNDVSYGAKYPGQNFVRANNQIVLLERLLEKEEVFKSMDI